MSKSGVLVQGLGINDNKCQSNRNGKTLKEYNLWTSMLFRCTEKYWVAHPTYIGTTCSENFKSYSYFYGWCQEQVGFDNIDENGKSWQLDKDLLMKGNKTYSEDTCVFLPSRVNGLLTKCNATRGELPIGVSLSKERGNYKSVCNAGKGWSMFLGRYSTPEQAFLAYKTFKEALIKEVANEYKLQLDPRAYQALMNYQVEITD